MWIILVIIIVLILIIALIYISRGIFNTSSHNTSNDELITWPSHQYITLERIGLTVHYMPYELQSYCVGYNPIESLSGLQIWHFNQFNQSDTHHRTMLFLMQYNKLSNYRWLIDLCRQTNINLALILVQPSLINKIQISRNWSPDKLILATDDDPTKLKQFINHDSDIREVRDRPVSHIRANSDQIRRGQNYLAIIIFIRSFKTSRLQELNFISANHIIIISDQAFINDNDYIVYSTDWLHWYNQSTVDLESDRERVLRTVVKLLSDSTGI